MRPDLSGVDPLELNLATRSSVGGLLTAVVVPADPQADAEALAERLVAHCREALGGFQVPEAMHVFQTLPRAASGKIQKADLRVQFRG